MGDYDNNLQVIVSKVVSENPKAPTLSVQVEIAGKKYSGGVWMWRRKDGSTVDDKNGNAQYIGKLKEWDSENPGAQRSRSHQPGPADRAFEEAHSKMQDDDFGDSEIPF